MVIGRQTDFALRTHGRMVRVSYYPDPSGPGTYEGRVVGGPARSVGITIRDDQPADPRSFRAFRWAALEMLRRSGSLEHPIPETCACGALLATRTVHTFDRATCTIRRAQ